MAATTSTTIENIVVSAFLADSLDLAKLASKLSGLEYNPGKWPGAMLKLRSPTHMILLFPNGKIVTHGSRSLAEANVGVSRVVEKLKEAGVKKLDDAPSLEIQNVVASTQAGSGLDLEVLAAHLPHGQAEYEPETFPGLIWRMSEPNVVLMAFDSGKLVVTGARSLEEVHAAFAGFTKEMETLTIS